MDIPVVYACSNAVVQLKSGSSQRIQFGTHWYANDPIVKANPNLFTSDVRFGMLYTEPRDEFDPAKFPPEYEQATAAPGERRSVRRG